MAPKNPENSTSKVPEISTSKVPEISTSKVSQNPTSKVSQNPTSEVSQNSTSKVPPIPSKVPRLGKEVIDQRRLCDEKNGLEPRVLDKVKLKKN